MDTSITDPFDPEDTTIRFRTSGKRLLAASGGRYGTGGVPLEIFRSSNSSLGWLQQTYSVNHPWIAYRARARLPKNIGGPFWTSKLTVETDGLNRDLLLLNGSGTRATADYHGDLFPALEPYQLARDIYLGTERLNAAWVRDDHMAWSELRVRGEQIMLSVVPTSAAANMFVNVSEPVFDGMFFGLPGRALLNGDVGGEFLNTVFGILPTVQAVKDFNTALDSYDKVIKQYRRDSGKIIRRKAGPYRLPEEVVTTTISGGPVTAGGQALTAQLQSTSSCTLTTSTNREVWYSGAFQYFIPENLSPWEQQILEWQRAYHILPSPSDVWELLPFSWLADWFTNGGNSLRHLFLQSSEGATQRYGYAMCRSTVRKTWVWRGNLVVNHTNKPSTITAVVEKTIKQRIRVSPFGVHFTGVDLNPRQLAILAALGIAK